MSAGRSGSASSMRSTPSAAVWSRRRRRRRPSRADGLARRPRAPSASTTPTGATAPSARRLRGAAPRIRHAAAAMCAELTAPAAPRARAASPGALEHRRQIGHARAPPRSACATTSRPQRAARHGARSAAGVERRPSSDARAPRCGGSSRRSDGRPAQATVELLEAAIRSGSTVLGQRPIAESRADVADG